MPLNWTRKGRLPGLDEQPLKNWLLLKQKIL
jgi:hypothetical protein